MRGRQRDLATRIFFCWVVEELDMGGKHTTVEISSGRTWIHINNLAFRQMFMWV